MGTDGTGIFENDECGSFLYRVHADLIAEIERDISSLDRGSLVRTTPGAVAILVAIAKHIPGASGMQRRADIIKYRERFLNWFDGLPQEDRVPPKYFDEYRKNVTKEFDELIGICSR